MESTVLLHLHVVRAENEGLARYVLERRQAILDEGGYKEKLDATLTRAYRNICECKDPILTLRDASGIKGIGQWTLKLLKGFFTSQEEEEQDQQEEAHNARAAGSKAKRRYIPQKSSAPYAILLTLYRALQDGREFMKRQELIDAADASGLSRMQIQPNKVSGPSVEFGYSTKDWYSGWSSMKTLLSKGLVVKSSCPAKYMLTEEGKATAEECLLRSGITTTRSQSPFVEGMRKCSSAVLLAKNHDVDLIAVDSVECTKKVDSNVPVFKDTHIQLCINEATDISSDSEKSGKSNEFSDSDEESQEVEDCTGNLSTSNSNTSSWLHLPPLKQGERFSDAYDVVLLLDDRERFMSSARGSASDKFSDQLRAQFHVEAEVRHLPIGDTLWIARHKLTKEEYVLDFIVERKKVNDLLHSIRDTRYKQQKLRLLRCGLRKLIYIVEGDPNVMDSAESIKTACFTTEIAEGFDVQRTNDIRDTMRKYGHLTHAISGHYDELSVCRNFDHSLRRTYIQFVDQCKDLEKERVTDVFGVMLMQVKQVTENIALSILEKYPTPLSLVLAYSRLAGDERAQEQLLKGIPILYQNKEISASISKKVFEFVCSTGSVTF